MHDPSPPALVPEHSSPGVLRPPPWTPVLPAGRCNLQPSVSMAAACAGSLGPSRSLLASVPCGWLEVGSFPPGPHLACSRPFSESEGEGEMSSSPTHSPRSCLSSVTGWRWRSRTTSPNYPLSEICFWGGSQTIFNCTTAFAKFFLKKICIYSYFSFS